MSGPRVLISHSASGRALAKRLLSGLADVGATAEAHSRPGKTLAARVRSQLDACEVFLVLLQKGDPRAAWLQQEIGYALARGARVLLVGARAEEGLLVDAKPLVWPRSAPEVDALAQRIRRALPATPRAAVRSLAQSSQEGWTRAIRDEATRELRARRWDALVIPSAWEGEHPVFVHRVPDLVWRKKIRGRWVYLRPRVTPFNPVDLATVRASAAPRVFEWWLLRNGRSDAWMRKLYRGASEPITPRSRFFGEPASALVRSRGGTLIAQRFLTQRLERTGEVAGELDRIEAWIAASLRARVQARSNEQLASHA